MEGFPGEEHCDSVVARDAAAYSSTVRCRAINAIKCVLEGAHVRRLKEELDNVRGKFKDVDGEVPVRVVKCKDACAEVGQERPLPHAGFAKAIKEDATKDVAAGI